MKQRHSLVRPEIFRTPEIFRNRLDLEARAMRRACQQVASEACARDFTSENEALNSAISSGMNPMKRGHRSIPTRTIGSNTSRDFLQLGRV